MAAEAPWWDRRAQKQAADPADDAQKQLQEYLTDWLCFNGATSSWPLRSSTMSGACVSSTTGRSSFPPVRASCSVTSSSAFG